VGISRLQAFEEITGFKVQQNRTAILATTAHEVQTEGDPSMVLVSLPKQRCRNQEQSESAQSKTTNLSEADQSQVLNEDRLGILDETSPYRSKHPILAKDKRKLAITPGYNTHPAAYS